MFKTANFYKLPRVCSCLTHSFVKTLRKKQMFCENIRKYKTFRTISRKNKYFRKILAKSHVIKLFF